MAIVWSSFKTRQFSVRTVLGIIALLSMLFALYVSPAQRQRRAVGRITARGGLAMYSGRQNSRIWWWRLCRTVGMLDFWYDVSDVYLDGESASEIAIDDLKAFQRLRHVSISDTQLTVRALNVITSLNVRFLTISRTPLSRTDIKHLQKLKGLQSLTLYETNADADAVASLRSALPRTTIQVINNITELSPSQ